MDMEVHRTQVQIGKARKKVAQPEKWKKNLAKTKRYMPKASLTRESCEHKKKTLKCRDVSLVDLKKFHDAFYSSYSKYKQDAFILKNCTINKTKRRRPVTGKHSDRDFQVIYHIYSQTKKTSIQVCQNFFLKILQIKKTRVQSVLKEYFYKGTLLTEKRGGDHVSQKNVHKKQCVMSFIENLQCKESHYCRGRSERQYLPADLNIKKLWRMYNLDATPEMKVTSSYFRRVLNGNYNLGFGSPRTDVCSTCLQLDEKIKTEKDQGERNRLMVEKRVHKLRAKAFFQLAQEERSDLITFSYDCQKNLACPKLPDQSAYFTRQINLYNFTIVQGSTKCKLTPQNVHSYCWTEDMYQKASNQIASAVYHRLRNTDLTECNTIRLIADGCGGQNKNSTMIAMCCKWFTEAPRNIKCMELIFPVVGHSYIPPDRVFGQIEKVIKKHEIVTDPNDYIQVISKYSTVIKLGEDCAVLDWKKAMTPIMKPVGGWHFQFSKCKRFILKKSKKDGNILVQGEVNYKTCLGTPKSVNKPRKTSAMISPSSVAKTEKINSAKAKDIVTLLSKHYGSEWRSIPELNFYANLTRNENEDAFTQDSFMQEEEQMCDEQVDCHTLSI